MSRVWIDIAYLIAATCFILGLKGLTKPRTAVRGNLIGAVGMLIAVVVTLLDQGIVGYGLIIAGAIVGAVVDVSRRHHSHGEDARAGRAV